MLGPIGQTATAHAGTELVTDHYCPHCGAISQAVAVGTGFGNPGFGSNVSEAIAHAQSNAQLDAARSVKLARCPKCGRRDGQEVRRLLVGSLVAGLLLGGAAGVIAFFLTFSSLVAALGVLAGAAGGLFRFGLKLHRSNQVYLNAPPRAGEGG